MLKHLRRENRVHAAIAQREVRAVRVDRRVDLRPIIAGRRIVDADVASDVRHIEEVFRDFSLACHSLFLPPSTVSPCRRQLDTRSVCNPACLIPPRAVVQTCMLS